MTDKEAFYSLLPNSFVFSDDQLLSICEISDILPCECPARLTRLLWETRIFYRYTTACIERFPEEAETHRLLKEKILQVEALLSASLVEFLQRQGLLDDQQQIDATLLKQHQIQAVLASDGSKTQSEHPESTS